MNAPSTGEGMPRDQSIDLMRFVAVIIIVLLHHMPSYYFNIYDLRTFNIPVDLSFLGHLTRYLGLGSFVFISGYLMSAK